jgi:neopullulanase
MKKSVTFLFCLLVACLIDASAKLSVNKLSPSLWYTNMHIDTLLVIAEGANLTMAKVSTTYPGVTVAKTTPSLSPGILSFEMIFSKDAKPGIVKIDFWYNGVIEQSINFAYQNRPICSQMPISPADVIYQVVPDRFSNGKKDNDNIKGMMEMADPLNPSGRHGGDFAGLSSKLSYLNKLGITAIELTPIWESNQPMANYDQWSVTNHYNIDPRLGTSNEFINYINSAKALDIKTICTFVFNQMGKHNNFLVRPSYPNWFFPDFGNYVPLAPSPVNTDTYASEIERYIVDGTWPDANTVALNTHDPLLQRYLIQNCLWWIATSGIDAVKIDKTYALPMDFLQQLTQSIAKAFPSVSVITDFESAQHSTHAHWLKQLNVPFMNNGDYPLAAALENAFSDLNDPTQGLNLVYNALASDYCLPNPYNNILFADNHKQNRAFSNADKDIQQLKLMLTLVFASRGIPQITYGTEALIDGLASYGLGFVRKDFPGLNDKDSPNAFTNFQTSAQQNHIANFLQQIIAWRKSCEAAQWGKLVHYAPTEGVYVFFRHTDNQHVMVIINNNPSEKMRFETMRFANELGNANMAIDMLTKQEYQPIDNIIVAPKSALILELLEKKAVE